MYNIGMHIRLGTEPALLSRCAVPGSCLRKLLRGQGVPKKTGPAVYAVRDVS